MKTSDALNSLTALAIIYPQHTSSLKGATDILFKLREHKEDVIDNYGKTLEVLLLEMVIIL